MAVKVTIDDREFQAALKAYMKVSRRSLAEIVNKRAVNIAYKSIRYTPKAKKTKIRSDLKGMSSVHPKAPIAALIVNLNARNRKRKGYYGDKMREKIDKLIFIRQMKIGFIRSGFLGAVKDLQPLAKVRRRPPRVNVQGKPKGYGTPARNGLNPTATIVNQVAGAVEVGSKAIQRAMQEDALDMRTFTAKRMQKDAKKFNA